MPELPEVQTVVDTLRPAILNRLISAAHLHRGDILTPTGFDLSSSLLGRSVIDLQRRGKKIVFSLDDKNRFYIHLGMTGRIALHPMGASRLPHTHLVLELGSVAMHFTDPRRFGGIWWLRSDESPDDKLGPEPLLIRPTQLAIRLRKTSRAIKNALLDQSLIAGLGNIYVDESLFRAGIHPLRPADKLSDEEIFRLNRAIKATLRKALRHRGSTLRDYFDANGNPGGFAALHAVYDRAGEACLQCSGTILRIVLGGRSTHFCPHCQPRKRRKRRAISAKPARL